MRKWYAISEEELEKLERFLERFVERHSFDAERKIALKTMETVRQREAEITVKEEQPAVTDVDYRYRTTPPQRRLGGTQRRAGRIPGESKVVKIEQPEWV